MFIYDNFDNFVYRKQMQIISNIENQCVESKQPWMLHDLGYYTCANIKR